MVEGRGAGRRRRWAHRRPRTGRARVRRRGAREQVDSRWQGTELAGAGLRGGRSRRPAGGARLSLLPGLLSTHPRHDEPDPDRRWHRARPADGGHQGDDRQGRRPSRDDQRGAPPGVARRPRGGQPVPGRVDDGARNPRRRAGGAHGATADAAHELRRAALRAVGAAELVGVRRRRAPLGRVPEVPRRRAHAHARGGPGDGRSAPARAA